MYFLKDRLSQRRTDVKQIINREEVEEYADTFIEEYV
jgi:hypothetical protein